MILLPFALESQRVVEKVTDEKEKEAKKVAQVEDEDEKAVSKLPKLSRAEAAQKKDMMIKHHMILLLGKTGVSPKKVKTDNIKRKRQKDQRREEDEDQ